MSGWLIFAAIIMWGSQTVLGLWQFKRFHRRVKELRQNGRVAIGKAKGKFLAGAVVLLCIDENNRIYHGEVMKGRTVFADFRMMDQLNGKILTQLSEEDCIGLDSQIQASVLDARRGFEEYLKSRKNHPVTEKEIQPAVPVPNEAIVR